MRLFPGCFFCLSIAAYIIRVKKIELLISYIFFYIFLYVWKERDTVFSCIRRLCVYLLKERENEFKTRITFVKHTF